jgi:hypothetical protein
MQILDVLEIVIFMQLFNFLGIKNDFSIDSIHTMYLILLFYVIS